MTDYIDHEFKVLCLCSPCRTVYSAANHLGIGPVPENIAGRLTKNSSCKVSRFLPVVATFQKQQLDQTLIIPYSTVCFPVSLEHYTKSTCPNHLHSKGLWSWFLLHHSGVGVIYDLRNQWQVKDVFPASVDCTWFLAHIYPQQPWKVLQ